MVHSAIPYPIGFVPVLTAAQRLLHLKLRDRASAARRHAVP